MANLASLGQAMESSYFRAEDANALRKHAERLVKEGKLSESFLRGSVIDAHAPSLYQNVRTVVRQKPASETVYNHVKGTFSGNAWSGCLYMMCTHYKSFRALTLLMCVQIADLCLWTTG